MKKEVKNAKKPRDGICLLKKYEDLVKRANRKIITIVEKQGDLLKRCIKIVINFLAVLAQVNPICILKYAYTNFYVNFQHWKYQLLPLAIFRAILKVVSTRFLLICFACLKESTCETRKMFFILFRKLFSFLR